MRITVGHILILAGVGGAAWMQLSTKKIDTSGLLDKYSSVTSSVGSLMDLFKSGAQPTPPLETQTKPDISSDSLVVEDKLPALEQAALPESPVPVESPAAAVPENKPSVVEAPVPAKKALKRRSKKPRAKVAKDPLLGTMVALTLSSGREVRGILEERSATSYKIQLPGMGPFTYDAANVKTIRPAN